MAGIGIGGPVIQSKPGDQFSGTALQESVADGMRIGIVLRADLLERSLKQIPDDDPLADMEIPVRINMQATRIAEVLVLALAQSPSHG